MSRLKDGLSMRWTILLVSIASTTGCVSSPPPPPPDQMSRTMLQTAPADLQLLCADAAAKSAGIERAKVLPMSSRQLDASSYSVELDATGRKFNCVIDNTGIVKTVQPV